MAKPMHCADGCPMFQPNGYVPGCGFWNTLVPRTSAVCDTEKVLALIGKGVAVLTYLRGGNEESETCKPANAETVPDIGESCPAIGIPEASPKPS